MIRRKKHGGRNNSGRITVWHRGGESKRFVRPLDLTRNQTCTGIVETISYDPNRSARIALVRCSDEATSFVKFGRSPQLTASVVNTWSYILAWEGLQLNDTVMNTHPKQLFIGGSPNLYLKNQFLGLRSQQKGEHPTIFERTDFEVRTTTIENGSCGPLSTLPLGTTIHNIEAYPGQGGQYIRASGTYGQIMHKTHHQCQVRLPSGVVKTFHGECRASVGVVQHTNRRSRIDKAGCQRWRGKRPHVRGVAMNPIDHPHGGRSRGHSVSPWGLKQGVKTRRKTK